MSRTDLQNFENQLFSQLKAENNDYLTTIESNKKIINEYLNSQDVNSIKAFVHEFNTTVLEAKVKNYKPFENVLNHSLFNKVLVAFRNSDIMVRACKIVNKNAVEWLLKMNINYNYQDENGMNALMHAAEHASLNFALEKIINGGNFDINMLDNNGNNALFHSTNTPDNLKTMLKTKINKHQLNNDGESLLLYCSRYDKFRSFEKLTKEKIYDPNLCNCVGKTTAMYLVENGRYNELKTFIKKNKIDPNYINKFGQSLVSVFVQKFYRQYIGDIGEISFSSKYNYIHTKNYALTMLNLVSLGCNFNIPVDKDGNTPIMVFLMMKDYITTKYLLDNCKIDLSMKNEYGMNASYLSLFIDEEVFNSMEYNKTRNANVISYKALKKAVRENPTFDNAHINLDENISVYPAFKYKNPYLIQPNYAIAVEQWMMEVYYPNAGSVITVGGNTYDKSSEFSKNMTKYLTGGLGTY